MHGVVARSSRTRQPSRLVRPAQRWIDRGLILAHSGSSLPAWSRNNLAVGATYSAPDAFRASRLGVGRDFSTHAITYEAGGHMSNDVMPAARAITLVSTVLPDGVSASARSLGFFCAETTLLNVMVESGAWLFQIRDNSSNAMNLSGGSASAGQAAVLVARTSGPGAAAAFFTPAGVFSGTAPADTVSIGAVVIGALSRFASPEQTWDGWLGDQFVFGAALTDAECAEIQANPFCIWGPLERRIWVPSAVAVPSITAVYADSVTASSVVPRVTLDFA